MYFEKFFKPAPKKNHHVAAKIIGGLAIASLMPVAINVNEKKKEWGVASLLVSVTQKPSKEKENKSEVTVTVPGVAYIGKCWRRAIRICKIAAATRKANKVSPCEVDDLDIDFDTDDEAEVIITEQE